MNEQEWEEQLTREGYRDIRVSSHGPNMHFGEHTHDEHTVHVILEGELTLIDEDSTLTLKKGRRIDIPEGTTHGAKTGPDGCTMLVGIK